MSRALDISRVDHVSAFAETCRRVQDSARAGNFTDGINALFALWDGPGSKPKIENLSIGEVAQLYFWTGVLSGGIGISSTAQREARRLLRRSVRIYLQINDQDGVARCAREIALSYWRIGHYRNARRTIKNLSVAGFRKLDLETEAAIQLIKALIEECDNRTEEALDILESAFPLFENVTDVYLSGRFHNTLGLILKNLGINQANDDYIQRAFIEFTAAGFYFEQTNNFIYLSSVENNLGILQSLLGKHSAAYTHIDKARALALSNGDDVRVAHFEETRARVLCDEGRLAEARDAIEHAVRELQRLGADAFLAEAITTRAEIECRIKSRAANVLLFTPPLSNLAEKFVVTVSDDSLVYAGIEAGDVVWLSRASHANDGDLVFVTAPDCVTLAFYFTDGDDVRLCYAHDECSERSYPRRLLRIHGIVLQR